MSAEPSRKPVRPNAWNIFRPITTYDDARRTARAGALVPAWLMFSYVVTPVLLVTSGAVRSGANSVAELVIDVVALALAILLTTLVWFRRGFWSSAFAMAWFLFELVAKAQAVAAGQQAFNGGYAVMFAAIFCAGVLGLRAAWRLRTLQRLAPGKDLDPEVFD